MALVLDVELVKHLVRVIPDHFVIESMPHLFGVVKCELLHVFSEFLNAWFGLLIDGPNTEVKCKQVTWLEPWFRNLISLLLRQFCCSAVFDPAAHLFPIFVIV